MRRLLCLASFAALLAAAGCVAADYSGGGGRMMAKKKRASYGGFLAQQAPVAEETEVQSAPAPKPEGRYENRELLRAAADGRVDAVGAQLEAGADVDAADKEKCARTALHYAALRGYVEVAKLVLHRGAGVDRKDCNDETALMLAAEKGHAELVRVLLKNGADLDAKDRWGKTPLEWAQSKNNAEVVALLKDAEKGGKAPAVPGEPQAPPRPKPQVDDSQL